MPLRFDSTKQRHASFHIAASTNLITCPSWSSSLTLPGRLAPQMLLVQRSQICRHKRQLQCYLLGYIPVQVVPGWRRVFGVHAGRQKVGKQKWITVAGALVTYPKPLDLPLWWSIIICASKTGPNLSKYSRKSSAVPNVRSSVGWISCCVRQCWLCRCKLAFFSCWCQATNKDLFAPGLLLRRDRAFSIYLKSHTTSLEDF